MSLLSLGAFIQIGIGIRCLFGIIFSNWLFRVFRCGNTICCQFYFVILELKGIESPSPIGFLTVLERLRYCEVGSYLKSPKFPIWVLGSETHLTGKFIG